MVYTVESGANGWGHAQVIQEALVVSGKTAEDCLSLNMSLVSPEE